MDCTEPDKFIHCTVGVLIRLEGTWNLHSTDIYHERGWPAISLTAGVINSVGENKPSVYENRCDTVYIIVEGDSLSTVIFTLSLPLHAFGRSSTDPDNPFPEVTDPFCC